MGTVGAAAASRDVFSGLMEVGIGVGSCGVPAVPEKGRIRRL